MLELVVHSVRIRSKSLGEALTGRTYQSNLPLSFRLEASSHLAWVNSAYLRMSVLFEIISVLCVRVDTSIGANLSLHMRKETVCNAMCIRQQAEFLLLLACSSSRVNHHVMYILGNLGYDS